MRINKVLSYQFTPTGLLETTESAQNIKMNGILVDFEFTPTVEYIAGTEGGAFEYRVLDNIYLSANLRVGSGSGKNSLLVDRVPLFLLLEYSDCVGGVDATLTPMEAGKKWRCSGYLPIGYVEIGDNDSLDFQLYCANTPEVSANVSISTDLREYQSVNIKSYSRVKPTGSSQTYDNVIEAYVTTQEELNQTISTTDQMQSEVINVESAIALTNAIGHFEKFKRFGQFYADPYGVGQTLTLNAPTDNSDTEILLVKYVYNLSLQTNGVADFATSRTNLFTQIANKDPVKFAFLRNMGLDMSGVTAVAGN